MRQLVKKSVFFIFFWAGYLGVVQAQSQYSFAVKKTGKGAPMIFIPGLYCGGAIWEETAAAFSDRYTCYMITLPGFDGQPPVVSDSLLMKVTRELAAFIRDEKLKQPVVIGHSTGGWLALNLGVSSPELTGDIICVSAAPFMAALSMGMDVSVDSCRQIGKRIQQYMAAQQPEQVKSGQQYILKTMIRDSVYIAKVMDMALRSDNRTQAQVMYELFSNDLRPALSAIRSRILVLGDWYGYRQFGSSRQRVNENLESQFRLARRTTIAISDSSLHFIMYDEPQWLRQQISQFLHR
ncbi:alpha/beta hydrolase [Chitinophaga sp. Mgbs1]|uniref:Alpha/beta hydrolase n=1 Tax=Chitinophaga solisilvae TaxID=1233460 RepID=A0A9Q5D6A0_9BACT|nr:alpha/beta hydrolase [Chitinophaga solisilvae]